MERKPLPQHVLSSIFPAMTDEEYRNLVVSISMNGQLNPITIFEGQVLDGWHRQRACFEIGIEPTYVALEINQSPAAFVMMQNFQRRQMNASQRAMLIVSIGDHFDTSILAQAKLVAVSPRTISSARKLLNTGDTETIEAVITGKKSIPREQPLPSKEKAPEATAEKSPVATKAAKDPEPAEPVEPVEDYVKITMEEYEQFMAHKEFLHEHDLESAFERQRVLIKNLERERDQLLENQNELIKVNAVQKKLLAKANNVVDSEVGF